MMISEPNSFSHSFSFNELQRVHPLSSLPNPSSFYHRATSPVQSQQSSSNNSLEDVTTIFVVGFPEDMAEREFQNMFTFCPGFEAASLKWHCKDQEDDIPLNGGKKQMIGFARFRTRLEALEAIEVLGGKKIDQDKGTVLKAEMAKKNLHIKKPTSTTTTAAVATATATATTITSNNIIPLPSSSSSSSLALANINNNINNINNINNNNGILSNTNTNTTTTSSSSSTSTSTTNLQQHSTSLMDSLSSLNKSFNPVAPNALNGNSSRYEAFSPLPSDLLSPHDYQSDLFMSSPNGILPSTPSQPSFNDSVFALRSQSFDHDLGFIPPSRSLINNNNNNNNNNSNSNSNNAPILPSRLKSVEEIASVDPYPYLSKSSPVPHENYISRHHASFDAASFLDQDLMRMSSLSILTSPPTHSNLRASSISVASPHQLRLHNNPADQNPPCNTIYVGNLPLNTSEDELRQLFSVCKGYRRMCFRTKPQGPMCFVEFEDIPFASHALGELQGYHLTNSVKGGIRLSYSKNPLFIKPNRESLFKQSDR